MGELVQAIRAALAASLQDALLYLDSGAAEVLASCVGLEAIQGLGVASVCDLVSASAGDLPTAALLAGQPVRRIAFAITTLLHQAEPLLLHACGAARQAAQFTILSAVSEAAHHDEQPSAYSPSCFAEAAARMQQHLNTARLSDGVGPCSVAVLHFPPLLLCPVLPSAFVFPATSAAALRPRMGAWPAGWATAPPQGLDSDSEGEDAAHPAPASAAGVLGAGCGGTAGLSSASSGEGLALLAHTLVQLAAVLGLRLEAFSCGPTSTQVAKHMAFVPPATSPSGEQPEETAALVLVDRACDLLTPALHPDLLLARMVDALPFAMAVAEAAAAAASGEREAGSSGAEAADSGGQSTPAAADKGSGVGSSLPLLAVPTAAHWQPQGSASAAAAEGLGSAVGGSGDGSLSSTLLPGSLCAPRDPQLQQWLAFLLGRCGKDAPLFLRKWLREALRKEGVPPVPTLRFKPGSTSARELSTLADLLVAHSPATSARQLSLTTLAAAATAALDGGVANAWDAAGREERQLLLACAEGSSDSAAAQLCELCSLTTRPGSPLPLRDVALLILAAHQLLPEALPWYAESAFDRQQTAALEAALAQAIAAAHRRTAGSSDGASAQPHGEAAQQEQEQGQERQQSAPSAEGWEGDEAGWDSGEPEAVGATSQQAPDAAARALLARCRQLAEFRKRHLGKELCRLTAPDAGDGVPRTRSLLAQITERILSGQPVPGLQHAATSLAGLLKSVGGRFGLQKQPSPGDYPTVLMFVVGGISMAELHEVAGVVDAAAAAATAGAAAVAAGGAPGIQQAPDRRVILGGSVLLRGQDIARSLLGPGASAV